MQVKNEDPPKGGLLKAPFIKGLSSSRFLPKGTKTKVDLEEQGRQKVSFTFSFTKKPLQNRFLSPLGTEKQSNDAQNSASQLHPSNKSEPADLAATGGGDVAKAFHPLSPKAKLQLGKMHFKKQFLSFTAKSEVDVEKEPPSSQIPESVELPGSQIPESVELPGSQIPESVELPGSQIPESVELPGSQIPESVELPGSQILESVELPSSRIPESVEPPSSRIPESVEPPSSNVPESVEPPSSNVPESVEPPSSKILESVEPPSSKILESVEPPSSNVLESVEPPSSNVLESVEPPSSKVLESVEPPSSEILESMEPSSSKILEFVEPPSSKILEFVEPPSSKMSKLVEPTSSEIADSLKEDISEDVVNNCSDRLEPLAHPEQIDQNQQEKDSHIGTKEENWDNSKNVSFSPENTRSKNKPPQQEGGVPGSESDADSVRTSSSHRSHEIKNSTSTEKDKESRKNSTVSKTDDSRKSSSLFSRSRTDRDEKHSSYSKSERDSRYGSSRSRSERERRRSRSRSRSQSRSRSDKSRASSSYSRSERSHYYESDRRYRRSSPHRDRSSRSSRSYRSRTKDSSDSEDEYRRLDSRSSDARRTSHSTSHRESRTSSYSRSDRDSKTESVHADSDKRTKSYSKSERESKRTSESDVRKRSSPYNDTKCREATSTTKSESNSISSQSKSRVSRTSSQILDLKRKNVSSSSESEDEIKQHPKSVDLEKSYISSKSNELQTATPKKSDMEICNSASPKKSDIEVCITPCLESNELNFSDPQKTVFQGTRISFKLSTPVRNLNYEMTHQTKDIVHPQSQQFVAFSKKDSINRSCSPNKSDEMECKPCTRSDEFIWPSNSKYEIAEASPVMSTNLQMPSLPKSEFPNPRRPEDDKTETSQVESKACLPSRPTEMEAALPFRTDEVKFSILVEDSEGLSNKFSPLFEDSEKLTSNKLDELISSPTEARDDSKNSSVSDIMRSPSYHSDSEMDIEDTDEETRNETLVDFPKDSQTANLNEDSYAKLLPVKSKWEADDTVANQLNTVLGDHHYVSSHPNNYDSNSNSDCLQDEEYLEVKSQSSLWHNKLSLPSSPENSFQKEAEETTESSLNLCCVQQPIDHSDIVVVRKELPLLIKGNTSSVDVELKKPLVCLYSDTDDETEELVDVPNSSEDQSPPRTVQAMENIGVSHGDQLDSSCDSSAVAPQVHSVYSNHTEYSNKDDSRSDQGSDESDTEDSDLDSDDSSIPRTRLQSVIVIPKNSTISVEEKIPRPSSRSSQDDRSSSDEEDSKPETSEHFSNEEKPDSDKSVSLTSTWKQERCDFPVELESMPQPSVDETKSKQDEKLEDLLHQSQIDRVDSTSKLETPSLLNEHHLLEGRSEAKGSFANRSIDVQQEDVPLSHSESCETTHATSWQQQNSFEKPASHQVKALVQQHVQEFCKVDGFHATEDLGSLGWDFSQPEKPSSTYQQPDSSYGMYQACGYEHNVEPYGNNGSYWQGNGCWDPTVNSRQHRGGYQGHPQFFSSDIRIQVHPDSLTNDYDEDDNGWEDDKNDASGHSPDFYRHDLQEAGLVQTNEITSNSIKNILSVEEREPVKELDMNDLKERMPLKKRRQDLESDSESDMEMREAKKLKLEELEPETSLQSSEWVGPCCNMEDFRDPQRWKDGSKQRMMPPYFDLIEENMYLTERKKCKTHRDIKRMQCECSVLTREERAQGEVACGEDCLNRLLMIECSSRCPNGDYCSNRRFQRKQHADVEVILTEKKGWGLRAAKDLPPNTFVLEYCGEVLDHKEFKARVKEYARSKNIHYYFMALKNDEIIDATQKGNCSRFMNHSCEPNCETQKWTVNGQLRVGFFTTKLVPAGAELTFDYQFQRYGQEAQKCFCGSANCRGYLGGENRVSIRAAGGKMKKERSRKKDSVDGELEALLENGEGLSDKDQVLSLSRLMVRIETMEQKLTCLKLIQNTHSQSCLKSFLDCHGLSLLWIWMTELGDGRGNSSNIIKLQTEIMRTLELLPIPNKNMLEESKVLPIIQRWAQTKMAVPQLSEGDGYSSENTSRAHTPLNTPDPASTKQVVDGEVDTPKKLVFRRLKIISENSMDSAISDTSKASDGEMEDKEGKEGQEQPEILPQEEEEPETKLELELEVKVEVEPDPEPKEVVEHEPKLEVDPEPPTLIPDEVSEMPAGEMDAEVKDGAAPKLEDPIAVETPSQDEEEGVSDVESERSQEPVDKMVDLGELATKLLDNWKDLKEVYRIPKKSQAEKESSDRGREGTSQREQTAVMKTPSQTRESSRDSDRQSSSKDRKKRRQSLSPPSSAYERGSKRTDDRYDMPTSSKKKSRAKDRNKLSTEERRKLFEQEVAQREAQKQQQQMQNLGINSPIMYDSGPFGNPHQGYMGYPPGYPMQTYVDPTNPNAGKVLLPTPGIDPMCSPMGYEHQQAGVDPAMAAAQAVPVVQHVPTQLDTQTQQYIAQPSPSPTTPSPLVPQDPTNVAVLPMSTPGQVQGQSYGVWDPGQPAVAVQQQYLTPQPTVYYQGQPCQPVYGITTPYPQTAQPIVQSYAQPGTPYIQGQPVYTTHPQGAVVQQPTTVTTIVAAGQPQPLQQPELLVTNNLLELPPPSPPKPKTIILPPNWKTARDPEGKIYYYHVITRQTQWDPPAWDGICDDANLDNEAEMDLGTPTYDENPMKDLSMSQDGSLDGTPNAYKSSKKPKTAEADTSSELAKKSKEVFRKEMSQFIVQCLNPYRKPDCKVGKITMTEDFKHLARKLTHGVMNKELKYCKNPEDLECNENVKHKTKEYIKKYMQKFGAIYKPKEDTDME
ncbi:histone-lysine N-methyltransferase SETD2 [Latimeria chalumnae]|uniref:histone-lysine N-methyltransferase SETD2 n=1 Tax=Latimeria chalumnae TaxID=7897 RepID=UPI00313AE20C